MQSAGLIAGDLIAVHTTHSVPQSGEIVVARSDSEITLRRLRRIDEHRVGLSPETTHSTHREQVVDLQDNKVRIEGVMVGSLIGRRPARCESGEASNNEEEARTPE